MLKFNLIIASLVVLFSACSKSTPPVATPSFTINTITYSNPTTIKQLSGTGANAGGDLTAYSSGNSISFNMEPYPKTSVSLPIKNGPGSGSSTLTISVFQASNNKAYFGGSNTVNLNVTVANNKITDLTLPQIWAYSQDLKDSIQISATSLRE